MLILMFFGAITVVEPKVLKVRGYWLVEPCLEFFLTS